MLMRKYLAIKSPFGEDGVISSSANRAQPLSAHLFLSMVHILQTCKPLRQILEHRPLPLEYTRLGRSLVPTMAVECTTCNAQHLHQKHIVQQYLRTNPRAFTKHFGTHSLEKAAFDVLINIDRLQPLSY